MCKCLFEELQKYIGNLLSKIADVIFVWERAMKCSLKNISVGMRLFSSSTWFFSCKFFPRNFSTSRGFSTFCDHCATQKAEKVQTRVRIELVFHFVPLSSSFDEKLFVIYFFSHAAFRKLHTTCILYR